VGFRGRRPEVRSGEKPSVSCPVEPLHSSKDDLLDRTREVWAPRLGGDLTREDARQIAANIVGFFEILNQWRLKQEKFLEQSATEMRDGAKLHRPHDAGLAQEA
jgi:hypothetical protein